MDGHRVVRDASYRCLSFAAGNFWIPCTRELSPSSALLLPLAALPLSPPFPLSSWSSSIPSLRLALVICRVAVIAVATLSSYAFSLLHLRPNRALPSPVDFGHL
ncbi:hypothetical protein PVAP13_9KG038049 [Panicum virgatum]|uniref:Uncharacterized protein n=1 Tax=Panicum virgatum TaxID=38727 RepID=A0A8T0NAP9_PANVG|nr:hypothetical protein PVAP13_9KG038049 [Panicum virgatum]